MEAEKNGHEYYIVMSHRGLNMNLRLTSAITSSDDNPVTGLQWIRSIRVASQNKMHVSRGMQRKHSA